MWVAVVGILCASSPFPAFFAYTSVGISAHYTGATILTGVWQAAAVFCYVAGSTFQPRWTHTLKGVSLIIASSTIVARSFIALAFTGVACFPLPFILALTEKIVNQVSTCASIVARFHAAVIDVGLAVNSFPAITTDALVNVHFVNACATIFAGITFTIVDVLMAVGSSKAFLAVTGKFAS